MKKSGCGLPPPTGHIFYIDPYLPAMSTIYGTGGMERSLVFGISVRISDWEKGYGVPERVYIVNSPNDHIKKGSSYVTVMIPVCSYRQKIAKYLGLRVRKGMNFLDNDGDDLGVVKVTKTSGLRIVDLFGPPGDDIVYALTYGVDGPWYTVTEYDKFQKRIRETEGIS